MKKVVKNKPLTNRTFKAAVIICLENDPINGLFNVEPFGMMPDWDVSNVTDMSYAFDDASSFNGNISNWNVSNVTNMQCMFENASSFNQDLSNWGLNSFVNMYYMFKNTPAWKLPKPNFKTPK